MVCNDFHLTDPERILVVSGPNNGGKTTFARTFGQLHYLASLGPAGAGGRTFACSCPIGSSPTSSARRRSRRCAASSRTSCIRIHEILERATSASVLIMNESFGSTTLRDAVLVGSEVVRQIIDLDALCVFVTFVDELSPARPEHGQHDEHGRARRIPRCGPTRSCERTADGLAYAAAIAEKYGLTYEALRRRVAR